MAHEKIVKGMLSSKNWMNIYRGCTHGCIYCDARSKCYNMQHDFEDIEIKVNAREVLEEKLKKKRNKCMIKTGAMSDPYRHLEEKLLQTRKCLEIINKYGFGVSVQTKSSRILRDIDLLKEINEKSKCVVEITITTYDDELCKILEPAVSTSSERFEVLQKLKDAGIPTIVWLSPILPFINDTEENITRIVEKCSEIGVHGMMFFNAGVTMREGNREYFYEKLDKYFPNLKEKYHKAYGNNYILKSPNNNKLSDLFYKLCKEKNMMCNSEEIFKYLSEFPSDPSSLVKLVDEEGPEEEQLKLF